MKNQMTYHDHQVLAECIKLAQVYLQKSARTLGSKAPVADPARASIDKALHYLQTAKSPLENRLYREHPQRATPAAYHGHPADGDISLQRVLDIAARLAIFQEGISEIQGAPAADTAIRDARRSLGEAARHLAALHQDDTP